MKERTFYYSSRKNIFVWLTALCAAASVVFRIMFFSQGSIDGFWVALFNLYLPVFAGIVIAIRLPLRCEDMYYVTIIPVSLLCISFVSRILIFDFPSMLTIILLALCIAEYIVYVMTFLGYLNKKIYALVLWLIPLLLIASKEFIYSFVYVFENKTSFVLMDVLSYFCILFIVIAAKRKKDDGGIKRFFGDRYDGRRVRTLCPLTSLIPTFMVDRVGSLNYFSYSIEIGNAERYIHEKRKEGLKHFGYTHLLLAAYARTVAEYPGLNRFIAGNKIFSRFDIICTMIVKKDMSPNSPDTSLKIKLDPKDTAYDVYEKYNNELNMVKDTDEANSSFDKFTGVINNIPTLIVLLFVQFNRLLDYFGMMLPYLMDVSPFHSSMFITSMGSLGIPPIYHHLYDFGNSAQFCSFGAKRTEKELDNDGNVVNKKYIDISWVADERTCDGHYYALVLKKIRSLILHPEVLDNPPEIINEDVK